MRACDCICCGVGNHDGSQTENAEEARAKNDRVEAIGVGDYNFPNQGNTEDAPPNGAGGNIKDEAPAHGEDIGDGNSDGEKAKKMAGK